MKFLPSLVPTNENNQYSQFQFLSFLPILEGNKQKFLLACSLSHNKTKPMAGKKKKKQLTNRDSKNEMKPNPKKLA